MPFYTRPRSQFRFIRPAIWGAGFMLLWTLTRVLFVLPVPGGAQPGVLGRIFFVLGFTILGGLLAGGFYWVLALKQVQSSPRLRWLAGAVLAAAYLLSFTFASSQWTPAPPVPRFARPDFWLGTLAISLAFGWLLGRDLLGWAGPTDRLYFSPGDFAALSPAEQAQLTPEAGSTGSERPA